MIFSTILALTLWGSANAATLGRRFSNGDFATGETDPNVSSGCTYWANSIKSTDTCAALESYYGITIAQLVSWVSKQEESTDEPQNLIPQAILFRFPLPPMDVPEPGLICKGISLVMDTVISWRIQIQKFARSMPTDCALILYI
jgi:hypothetical protein